jgi:hypothetical protein
MHAPVAKDEWLGQTKEGGKKMERKWKEGHLCLFVALFDTVSGRYGRNDVSGKKVSSDGTDDRLNFIVACVELQTFVMAYMEKTLYNRA